MSSITPSEVGSFFLTLVVPITIGAASAGITAYLALNRFYREKWWEKKHTAYNLLIDKLIELKDMYRHASNIGEMEWEADQGLRSAPLGRVDWNKLHELSAQVHRLHILSPISFGNKASELLNGFFEKDSEITFSIYEEGYPDFVAYSDLATLLDELIIEIVKDAKQELRFS